MSIQFAAVHERNSWRRHSQHQTLEAATTGEDGAENLLLNHNRAPAMQAKHGPAHAVFVWDDSEQQAVAFRLKPGSSFELERALVPVDMLERFKRYAGPSPVQIAQWFSSHAPNVAGQSQEHELKSEVPSIDKTNQPTEHTGRRYRYGDSPTWEVVLEAVHGLGRPVSLKEVGDRIVSEIPDFARGNLGPDLSVLSVNCFSRGNHAVNRAPRRTNTGNVYDKLIRLGKGRGVRFAMYDPSVHGVWALVDVGDENLRPRFLGAADGVELEQARRAATVEGMFDPSEDARRRIMAAIVQREGQPAFRKALLATYGGACAISGCRVEALLDAAHIVPYRGAQTNLVGNGLLLRADLHKMFDLHLFRIDPKARTVHLSEVLKTSEYACFEGVALREPRDQSKAALTDALKHHEERCGWMNATPHGAPLDDR
jgi:hypothetical protein